MHIATAGHLPPVVALSGLPSQLADIPADLMIGVEHGVRRQATTVKIPPGARLCQAVVAEPPDAACAAIMAAMVGGERARDDVAVLAFRREPADSRESG